MPRRAAVHELTEVLAGMGTWMVLLGLFAWAAWPRGKGKGHGR